MNAPVLEKTVREQSAYPELSGARVAIGSAGVLLGALAIARCIYLTHVRWHGEKGVLLTGALFAVFLVVSLGAYLLKGNPRPATAGLIFTRDYSPKGPCLASLSSFSGMSAKKHAEQCRSSYDLN